MRNILQFTFLLFVFAGNLTAQENVFKVPALSGPVVDNAKMLDSKTTHALESSLRSLFKTKGTQIVVLTVDTLFGLPIEQASIQVVETWKLGTKKEDNGVLLLVSLKDKKFRIEVGQGLEGVLTDAYSKRILDEVMSPLFKQGDISGGVLAGVYQIVSKTNPNFDFKSSLSRSGYSPPKRAAKKGYSLLEIVFFGILFFFLIFTRIGRTLLFYSLLTSGSRSGGGLGGGGGFGGGGGGFSGGGASGGW